MYTDIWTFRLLGQGGFPASFAWHIIFVSTQMHEFEGNRILVMNLDAFAGRAAPDVMIGRILKYL